LGFCDAPARNDFYSPVSHRLELIYRWIGHLKNLGINVVQIGPLFEATSHGYDTADYYQVDRRIGDRNSLRNLISTLHQNGIRVIFDAVFNHVGRDFWAFRDVRQKGQFSWYCHWFQGLQFGKRSPFGDPFTYKSWKGHYHLVKLNLNNPYVKEHLLRAVEMWISEFDIDGLRLDAADCLKVGFISDLKKFCKKLKPDFWLLGEIVKGDYRKKSSKTRLDSVTNYQLYGDLLASFNQKNFSPIAKALKWQFGSAGIYKNLNLSPFVDNHDLDRVASRLNKQAHLYPLYALLFTIPGTPALYYGSEFAIKGKKKKQSDAALRPFLDLGKLYRQGDTDLLAALKIFSQIRKNSSALAQGEYLELYVGQEQFAFARFSRSEYLVILLNSSDYPSGMNFQLPGIQNAQAVDLLNPQDIFLVRNGQIRVEPLWPNWLRILKIY